jgi:hypothetical protein
VVVLTAVPSTGCQFNKWSGDIDDNEANSSTISVVMDRARTITADFTGCELPYIITVAADTYLSGSTTINASFGIVTCSATQTSTGTTVNVTAVAAEGYHFDRWSGAVNGSQKIMSFVAGSSEAITAEFSEASSSPWLWVIIGIIVFLLIGLLIYRFKSGRAKKMEALQGLDSHTEGLHIL